MSHLDINQPPKKIWRRISTLGFKKASPVTEFFTSPELNSRNVAFSVLLQDFTLFLCLDRNVRNVSGQEITEAIFSIKSEEIGLDNVSVTFVKLIAPSLIPHITNFLNFCYSRDTFPAE
jgi:hypothetical protein